MGRVLGVSGTFRAHLNDDHTKSLKAEEIRQAGGTVQLGVSDDAPKIDLAPKKKKETLEANLGGGVKFLVALLPHLPGLETDAKPELFNFKFMRFAEKRGPGSRNPVANMPNMSY